jgi:hypothetical protein
MINQDQCDWDALSIRLSDIFRDRADKVAFLKGDEEVPFAQVARAIDLMRGAGDRSRGPDHASVLRTVPFGSFSCRETSVEGHSRRCPPERRNHSAHTNRPGPDMRP